MGCRRLLLTNNPYVSEKVAQSRFVQGSSLDVLIQARDCVHGGWRLLSHPLYGNLRPHQHPYRSILLELSDDRAPVDVESLEYMESALAIYSAESERIPSALCLSEELQRDFGEIDWELMKESLAGYGMMSAREAVSISGERR